MASKFFVPGTERAPKVGDLFATIAPRYDVINDLQSFGMHRLWKHQMVAAATLQPGDHALDVCCGTGDVTFKLAQTGADTVGFDFSQPMLDVAKGRAAQVPLPAGSGTVEFQQGDALNLPFADRSFDVVTISYGLRNLADFQRGLRELNRVLKPGGRLLVLDFGKPDFLPWRWVYYQYLERICPLFGKIFCGDGDTHGYILDSLKAYPAQHGVDSGLRELGFTETRIQTFLGGTMTLNIGRRR
jgi:demethylmenaquinone methyltransferase/2-methoxy-6-polyprenyl-1,4-benzoquinol methylase